MPALGQQSHEDALKAYRRTVGDHSVLYRGRLVTANYRNGWATHPYLGDEEFHDGTVIFRGVVYSHVPLRYDAYNRQLHILSSHSERAMIIDQQGIDGFTLQGRQFVPCQDGFVESLYSGVYLRLENNICKVRTHDEIRNNIPLINLLQTSSLGLHINSIDYPVKNLKSIQKLFPAYKQQLSEYSKLHHLRFKGEQRIASLKVVVEQLDKWLQENPENPSLRNYLSSSSQVQPLMPDTVQVPDLGEETVSSSIPAYKAYREENTDRPQYADEVQQTVGQKAGISELKPVKEERILEEVIVTSFSSKVDNLATGTEKFRPAMLRNMPMSMGESDVMKMVQTLPGVTTLGEASSGFNVRGGASDQNLLLLGSNTVYNPMHMFGLFSAFNTDAIGEVELYKSSVPCQYGGRTSSVMFMQNRMASKQKWSGSVSFGMLTSKAQFEMPLIKDKLSLMLAARSTYSDWMLKLLPKSSDYKNGTAGFYDMNGGLSWNLNARNVLNINAYYSHDRFSFTSTDKYAYSNANASIDWKGYWSDNLSSTLQFGIDHYDYSRDDKEVDYTATQLTFDINQFFFKGLFSQRMGDKHTLKYGWDATYYKVQPGRIAPASEKSNISPDTLDLQDALLAAFYLEDDWHPLENLRIMGGLRYNLFSSFQKGYEKTYHSPELRLGASYLLPKHQSVKIGFGNLSQFIHKVSNTVIMSPTDTWTLSNAQIKPQHGWQVTGGYYWRSDNSRYEISAEAYFKRISDYPTYGSAAQLVMNHELSADLIEAQGKAYGVELQLKKSTGALTGWLSYTYSRTFLRHQDDGSNNLINGGKWYPAEYDHPHEFNLVTNLKFTERYSMSLNVDYSTGRPTTVPAGKYYDYKRQEILPYYTERNGYRLPDNFRMDVSFNFAPSHHITNLLHCWFSVGCYNVTGRRNVYSLYYKPKYGSIQGYRLSIFGAPIPYVSFNFKF